LFVYLPSLFSLLSPRSSSALSPAGFFPCLTAAGGLLAHSPTLGISGTDFSLHDNDPELDFSLSCTTSNGDY
jgi:hypothetical protein